jgi:valyl-tRNA synthetase
MDDVVKKHGADTLRLFYYVAGKAGGSYNFDWKRIKFNQRFLNKVWNAARFVLINTQSIKNRITPIFTEEDRKITEHVKELSKDISQRIEKFKFNIAAERVFKSFWHTFCDKYIESTKSRIYFNLDAKDVINLAKKESLENDEKDTLKRVQQKLGAQITLKKVLKDYLKILHPFTPFITEALWQYFREEKDPVTIMHAKWPT